MRLLEFRAAAFLFVGYNPKPSSETEAGPQSAAKVNVLHGKVHEPLSAGWYSYLRLSTSSGEIWAAVFPTEANVGSEITILNPMPMDGFQTKTLDRKFDRVVFGTLGLKSQDQGQRVALHNAHDKISSLASTGPIQVQRAVGSKGRTIADIFPQKTLLRDREIAVTGKVVKVNADIMSGAWTHSCDGSGDPEYRTNDLTVTTQGSTAVGNTVMVKGTLLTDKHLGMGYVF
jgi:hypothetical protein